MRRLLPLAGAFAAVLLIPCVTDTSPSFYPRSRPELLGTLFVRGQIGILQATLRKKYELIAWRYLAGLPLDTETQQALLDAEKPAFQARSSDPQDVWLRASEEVAGAGKIPFQAWYRNSKVAPGEFYLNCLPDAFATAAITLSDRKIRYADNSLLRDWVAAQQQVFSNCGGQSTAYPAEPSAALSSLANADRLYQIAAAHFYAEDFGEAERRFRAIAATSDSPWRPTAAYMVARTLMRRYSLLNERTALEKAAGELDGFMKDPAFAPFRSQMERLRHYVGNLLDPQTAFGDVSARLSQPNPGRSLAQDIEEAAYLMSAERYKAAWSETESEPFRWVRALESKDAGLALKRWEETHSAAWLTVAILYASASDPSAPGLIAAGFAVPATSPAYDSVTFHAIRLLIESGHRTEARQRLDALLRINRPLDSVDNSFREQRMSVATSFGDLLRWAPRRPVAYQEEGPYSADEKIDRTPALDRDSISILNYLTPLTKIADAAAGPQLPAPAAADAAISAWTRAFMLRRDEIADRLTARLATSNPSWSSDLDAFRSAAGEEKRFAGAVLIERHSGIRPTLYAHFARDHDRVEPDWWCAMESPGPGAKAPPGVFTEQEQATAARELRQLIALGSTQAFLGPIVIPWAKAHPDDQRVPEALHRLVRVTRYGCRGDQKTGPVSKQAFDILHSRYPDSPWTAKTP